MGIESKIWMETFILASKATYTTYRREVSGIYDVNVIRSIWTHFHSTNHDVVKDDEMSTEKQMITIMGVVYIVTESRKCRYCCIYHNIYVSFKIE